MIQQQQQLQSSSQPGSKRARAASSSGSTAGPSGQAARHQSCPPAGPKKQAGGQAGQPSQKSAPKDSTASGKGKTFGKCHAKNQRNRRRLARRKEEAEQAAAAQAEAEAADDQLPPQEEAAQQAAGQAVQQPAHSNSRPQSQLSNDSGLETDISINNKTIHDRLGKRIQDRLGSEKVPEDIDEDMTDHPKLGEGQNHSVFDPVPKSNFEINKDNLDTSEHTNEIDMSDKNDKANATSTPNKESNDSSDHDLNSNCHANKSDKSNDSKQISKRSQIKKDIANKIAKKNEKQSDLDKNKKQSNDTDKQKDNKNNSNAKKQDNDNDKQRHKKDKRKSNKKSKNRDHSSDSKNKSGMDCEPSTSGTANPTPSPQNNDEMDDSVSDDCLVFTDKDVQSLMKGKEGKDSNFDKSKDNDSDRESFLNVSIDDSFAVSIKKNIPRPNKKKRHYECTIFDKLDNMTDNDEVSCTGCDTTTPFYKEGDTIYLVVGASTLLPRENKKDKDEVTIGKAVNKTDCVHFEYIYSRGGTFDDLRQICDPIISYLRLYFNLEILVCLGVNDLTITHRPYKVIIDAAKRMDEAFTKIKKGNNEGTTNVITVKYMTIPFIPAICQLLFGDKHDLKNDCDRIKDIVLVNRYLDNVLNAKNPKRSAIPGLHMLGISQDPLDNFYPTHNKHVFSQWEYGPVQKKDLSKNFRKTKEVIHLALSQRLIAWNKIHSYFYSRKFMSS